MHKVLIAARFMGWSAIAISMGSCNSPAPTAQNPPAGENTASSKIANVETSAPPDNGSRLDSSLTSSPLGSSPPIPKVGVAKSAQSDSVPYVNPLDSIPLLARNQLSDVATSKHQSSSLSQPNPGDNPDDGNVQLEQLSSSSNLSNSNDRLAKHAKQKHQNHNTSLGSDSCPTFPCLVLSQDPNNPQNSFNNPIYKLIAYRDKTSNMFELNAVTGRAFTQARNRYKSNTEAPLPDGSYAVSTRVVQGNIPEVGGTMIPIFPKPGFNPKMRRTALGIHWDPSFDRDKKEDGTSGCIGLTTKSDYHQVRDFILKYHPRSLEVKIAQ